MRRRNFLVVAGAAIAHIGGLQPVSAAAGAAPAHWVNVGQAILASARPEEILALRAAAPGVLGLARPALAAVVATEHRRGETVSAHGIALARSEAALCLAAADGLLPLELLS